MFAEGVVVKTEYFGKILLPVGFLLLVLGIWQLTDAILEIKPIILPNPLEIAKESFGRARELLQATSVTAMAACIGFAISIILGTVLALVFSASRLARQAVYPYMILLQTVPIVAIAPLVVIWFGGGLPSMIVIVTTISVFPIITNVTTGLTTVDDGLIDLMNLYQANRTQVLFKLQLPNAVPYLLAGARVAAGLTIVGAIVGEYMAGHDINHRGLGYYIFMSSQNFQTEILYASILLSTLLGVAMVGFVSLLGKTLLKRWTYQVQS